jgi:signal peptidase I
MDNEISTPRGSVTNENSFRHKWDLGSLLHQVVSHGFGYLFVAVLTYGFFQFSHRYLVQTVQVDGMSMSPTLQDAQCYFLNRVIYLIREPEAEDIVVLRDPETNGCAIKRIVARPGDSVYLKGGHVYVNGKVLAEQYLTPGTKTFTSDHYRAEMWICGVDQYFVMGDNRNNSADSRVYGAVPRANILGMVTP